MRKSKQKKKTSRWRAKSRLKMLLVSGKVIHLYEIWKKNYLNDDDDVGEVFFFNFGSKSPLVAGFFVLERKRIFNFSETLNTFCSWKINVPMYGVLWGLLFKWKKIRCQVWKFRFFFKLYIGICGIFLKFQISGFRACFSFRQALSRLALLTLLCCLAAALPGVQACRRFKWKVLKYAAGRLINWVPAL